MFILHLFLTSRPLIRNDHQVYLCCSTNALRMQQMCPAVSVLWYKQLWHDNVVVDEQIGHLSWSPYSTPFWCYSDDRNCSSVIFGHFVNFCLISEFFWILEILVFLCIETILIKDWFALYKDILLALCNCWFLPEVYFSWKIIKLSQNIAC